MKREYNHPGFTIVVDDTTPNEIRITRTTEAEEIEDEATQLRQAIGLMTTASPSLEMNPDDPISMAHQVVRECTALRHKVAQLEEEIAQHKGE